MKYENFLTTHPALTYENVLKAKAYRVEDCGGKENCLDIHCTAAMFSKMTEEEKIKLVTEDPKMIKALTSIPERVLYAAVDAMPSIISLLPNVENKYALLMHGLRKDPKLFSVLSDTDKNNLIGSVIEFYPEAILEIKYPNEGLLESAIKKKPSLIKYYPEKLNLAKLAFEQDPSVMMYINPNLLPRNDETSIDKAYIEHAQLFYENCEEYSDWALNSDPELIFKIINPTDAQYLIAFKSNPHLIRYFLDKVSEEIILETLSSDNMGGNVIRYIPNPTQEMKLAAVKNSSMAIMYIQDADEEVITASLNHDSGSIAYMSELNLTEEQIFKACSDTSNDYYINNFPNISESLMIRLLNANSSIFRYFAKPTKKVCTIAIKLRAENVKWVNPDLFSEV